MNLFRIADRPIAWADVQDFCAQREVEGATLDYKKDIPKELERVISAMANTLGGVIIIGVAEDNESRPVVPAEGIAMAKGLVERITSICVDNIYPPIVPDTQLCVNDAGDKAFLVIRVDQSREAPHAIGSNTRVYVRTGSLSDPDVLATLDRIKWLSERREGAERFREWLYVRASERFNVIHGGAVTGIPASREEHADKAWLTLAVCPVYPSPEPLVRSPEMAQIRNKILVPDPMGTDHEFPISGNGTVRRNVEDGYVMHWAGGVGLRTYHTHLNIHGLYYFRQTLAYNPKHQHASQIDTYTTRMIEIVDRAFCVLESAEKFYREVGYQGPLTVRLELDRIDTLPMWVADLTSRKASQETCPRYSADRKVEALVYANTRTLASERSAIVCQLVQRVAWAYDWDVTPGMLTGYASWRKGGL